MPGDQPAGGGLVLLGLRVVRADLGLLLAVMIEPHPRHQGWHDRAAGTLVVRSRA